MAPLAKKVPDPWLIGNQPQVLADIKDTTY